MARVISLCASVYDHPVAARIQMMLGASCIAAEPRAVDLCVLRRENIGPCARRMFHLSPCREQANVQPQRSRWWTMKSTWYQYRLGTVLHIRRCGVF